MKHPVCKYELYEHLSGPPTTVAPLNYSPSLSCLQVPPELLWGKVSVLHAALGEAPGGLQPDHSSGRGGRGALICLSHHHRPFVIAEVRKRLIDSLTNTLPTTIHTQIKGFTRGLADTRDG